MSAEDALMKRIAKAVYATNIELEGVYYEPRKILRVVDAVYLLVLRDITTGKERFIRIHIMEQDDDTEEALPETT